MNLWRWLGMSMLLLGAMCLVGTGKLPVYAGGKDKKPDDKKTVKQDDKKKVDDTKKQDDKKKVDDKKKQEVKQPVATGALKFLAFDPKLYPKGFYQEQHTKTNQKMQVQGQDVVQDQDQTFLIEWMPKEIDKDGNFVVVQKIVGVRMTINIGGNKISYDSTLPEDKQPKNPMTEFFGQLRKNALTFTVAPDLSVKSISGRKEFIDGLGAINPQMKSLLDAILSDEALKKMAEPTWYAFPPKGDISVKTWQRKSELNLGPIGKYNTTFDFTYKGQDGNNDNIDIKTKLEYTAPTEKAGLPFIIHEAKLSSDDKSSGKAVFDRVKGRFVSSEINMTISGTLKIEVGSMKTDVTLTQTQTAKSTTSDEIPSAWKTK